MRGVSDGAAGGMTSMELAGKGAIEGKRNQLRIDRLGIGRRHITETESGGMSRGPAQER
jgi:hypothetical protein